MVNSRENVPINQIVDFKEASAAEAPAPLLPRSAWNSQVAFLRAMFRAKKALDRIDREQDLPMRNEI